LVHELHADTFASLLVIWHVLLMMAGERDFEAKMEIVLAVAAMDLKIEAEHTHRKLMSITKDTSGPQQR
jgi:hypothetical protein